MDALTNNALVNMPGPTFLAFFAVVSAISLAALNLLLRIDSTGGRPPPPVPSRPDPYEIAYLRGSVGAVIELAVYALKSRELIEMQSGGRIARVAGLADPTNPIEARVLEEVGLGETAAKLLGSRSLRASLASKCETYRQRLERQDLIATDSARARGYAMTTLVGAALVALAALKIVVAEMHAHRNVGFLFAEAAVAVLLLFFSVQIATRSPASQRGRAYLNQVKGAYSGQAASTSSAARFDPIASGVALAAVGALGFAALRGTSDEAFAREFTKNSGGSSGGGGSCSSDGGDGGGGCGGCGGGGD